LPKLSILFFQNSLFKFVVVLWPRAVCHPKMADKAWSHSVRKGNYEIHDHNTRSASQFHKTFRRTNYAKHTLAHKGINVWNVLLNKNKNIKSYTSFKTCIKNTCYQMKKNANCIDINCPICTYNYLYYLLWTNYLQSYNKWCFCKCNIV
jgi:hypothetical protein